MTETPPQKDLLVLAADMDASLALQTLLARHRSLQIRPITFRVDSHPDHDAGCRSKGCEYLRNFTAEFRHSLLVFDHEGCGQESVDPSEIAKRLDGDLAKNGWDERARTIVLVPELDMWVWSDSPHVAAALGWQGRSHEDLKKAACEADFWHEGDPKPHRPKEALQLVLRKAGLARSSAIYQSIAKDVTFKTCEDPAFALLRSTLQKWFPENET